MITVFSQKINLLFKQIRLFLVHFYNFAIHRFIYLSVYLINVRIMETFYSYLFYTKKNRGIQSTYDSVAFIKMTLRNRVKLQRMHAYRRAFRVLLLELEETGVPREKHRPVANHWQTLSHNVVSSTPRLNGIRTHNVSGDKHWLPFCNLSVYLINVRIMETFYS
jgi:hypothetical protein